MTAGQAALPLIRPTVRGCVEGIVSLEPRVLQCQECGVTADPDTVGLPESGRRNPALVHILSGLRFHSRAWTGGQADNPRLCKECRQARQCGCVDCRDERRG